MGTMKRLSTILHAKANKILDRHEDPRETLDYSYERQLELLQQVRRGVADVATSRKRIELQASQLQQAADKLDTQARQSISHGREDLAREALSRKATIGSQLNDLQAQHEQLAAQEAKLVESSQKLQAKVDSFRTQKETIKANYTAAEAETKIGEAVSGISEEMGDVGLAMQRANDKVAQMQARAGAVDELLASGALEDATTSPRDDIQAELDKMSASASVEADLERIKGEVGGGPAPKAIEADSSETTSSETTGADGAAREGGGATEDKDSV
jgi:phage shock protein A